MVQVEFPPASIFDSQVKEVPVEQIKKDEGYVDLLVRVSLLLVSKDFPLEVQCHGAKMLQHLLKFRREELSSADLLNLTLKLAGSPKEDHIASKSENPKEQSKHKRSLLVLAANNNLRNLYAEETGCVRNDNEGPLVPFLSLGQRPLAREIDRIDFCMALEPDVHSSQMSLVASVRTSSLEGSPPIYSYNAPSSSKSVLSHALSRQYGRRSTHKHQCYSFPREAHLYSLPFPVDGPVPIAYFGLGTKSDFVNVPRIRLEPDGSSHSSGSNKSGSSSETSYWFNSESNSNSNSSDEQENCDESEHEIKRLMAIDIFDCTELDDDKSQDFTDLVHPKMLRFYGKAYGHHVKGCLLLVEHNILCQGFVVLVCLRNPAHGNVVHHILNLLNMIWNKSDWGNTFVCNGFGLSCLFCDKHFLKMVCNMVKLWEDVLKTSIQGQSDHTYFISLLPLILPLLLKLLRSIHSLWTDQIACNLFEELEKAKSPMNKGLKTAELLEEIRDCGYNVLGLCMSLEGAFAELLDVSCFITAFVDFNSMEFTHLRKVILAVSIPLVKHCPKEDWKEWMLEFFIPLLRHCEELLHSAWFTLLYEGRAEVPYYFGKISEEFEYSILVEFTRAVCQLLANMTPLESSNQNITTCQDLECMSSCSLVWYLLVHDCFWRLRVSLFGYWVDGEAARDGIQFCRNLVWLAGVTKDERLRLFVMGELLPSLIKCIDDELPCAFRKLSSRVSDDVEKDLIMLLCRELYDYLLSNLDEQIQDIIVEGKDVNSSADNFTCWLAKQKKDLRTKARHPRKEFINQKTKWDWEFEDEFGRYLPLYISMLKKVDAIDASSKVDYSDWEILDKLTPEFRSKYAINSVEHPHFMTISCMSRRKFRSAAQVRKHNQMSAILQQLITLEPHIKGSDPFYSVIDRLEKIPEIRSTFGYDVEAAVEVLLDSLLDIWEPQYHPIIRKEHKDLLVWIIEQLTKGKEFEDFQPLEPDLRDFPSHLEPYAMSYIVTTLETSVYATVKEQLLMHVEFDNHLSSGVLDNYIYESFSSKADLSGIDVSSCAVPHNCLALDHELINLSLQRRAKIVTFNNQAHIYSECLRNLLADDSLKGRLTNLMSELEVEGFFDIDSADVNWEKKSFIELVDRFKDEVFDGCSLPRHYIIRGIIDYRTILTQKDTWGAFKKVVGDTRERLSAYLPQFWRDTRHYKHHFYDVVQQPLEKIFV